MRKLLLLSSIVMTVVFLHAQTVFSDNSYQRSRLEETPVVSHNSSLPNHAHGSVSRSASSRPSRAITTGIKLNSQRIGSAGNLLTVGIGNANQIDINDVLNTVAYIHRNDPSIYSGTVATYRYDESMDGGNTFTSNIGSITNNPRIDNDTVACRFPQALIFNPAGNTNVDSGYFIYSGTYHNSVDGWKGQSRGRGSLSEDTTTFNVHIDSVNNGAVAIATGLCHGAPGVFWNLNQTYPWDIFHSGINPVVNGIIVEKGVWDSTTRDVIWTDTILPVDFQTSGGASEITSMNMAFDPTGQYGWICGLGDLASVNATTLNPIFWRTTDFGNTWSAPFEVILDSLPNVVNYLVNYSNTLYDGGPTSMIPTTAFDEDMVVDYLGNPHMVVVIGNATGYSIESAPYAAWDITFTQHPTACDTIYGKGYKAIFLSPVETLRGTLSNDNPAPETEDNRPGASESPDGKKIFLFWLDSDINFTQSDVNDFPNLFTIGIDVEHFVSTPVVNLTIGDSLWGGETVNTSAGLFYGAPFGTIAPYASQRGSSYNVPVVLTQIDYNKPATQQLGSYLNPCAFWYINNINFDPYDFINGQSAQIVLNGNDTVQELVNNAYVDEGATIIYGDTICYPSGVLHLVIDSSGVDYNQLGNYVIRYFAENDSGIIYGGTLRTVEVGRPPVANFTFHPSNPSNHIQFEDISTFGPTMWSWDFGDGHGGSSENPLHTSYPNVDATYYVCLTASNAYGSSDPFCDSVTVTKSVTGVNDIDFSEHVNLYPNPTSGNVSVEISETLASEITVSVLDLEGQTVVGEAKYQAGTNLIEMDLSDLASGMYFVKVYSANQGTAIKYLTVTNK